MKNGKKFTRLFLMFGVLLTLCTSTFAAPATEWPVDIHVMTMEERAEMQDQTGDKVTIGTAYLSKNNTSGTNGNICSPFTAEKTGMAFVLINAPGATDYNVQLYVGKPGEGERVSNYATVDVNNGVYFTVLTIGAEYYIKISSSTLVTNGCTATYEAIAFDVAAENVN